MKVIGITGGIGSGKSTVLHVLEEFGAYVIEADKLAHQLMEPGQLAYKKIIEVFGSHILQQDGKINRQTLGQIVFSDAEQLQALNNIVHPAVKTYIVQDINDKRIKGHTRFYVIEAALLLEDGYREICDEIWYIYTQKEERIRRLLKSRGGTIEKWEQIIANQSKDEYYNEHSDYVVNNGSDLKKTVNIVKELLS